MSQYINVNIAMGEAILQECERQGFKVWVDDGSAQLRVRDTLADPADNSKEERARAAGHTPRAMSHQLHSELNNKRGSILQALRARAHAARVAAAAADPVTVEQPSIQADPPKGVINQPGFGGESTPYVPPTIKIPGNPDLDPTVDPVENV